MAASDIILTWREAVDKCASRLTVYPKDMGSLITFARQRGVGEAVSFQKTRYTPKDLERLSILIRWWVLLDSSTNPEFRDAASSEQIRDRVVHSVLTGEPLIFFGIFCPSYKTGVGVYGFNRCIGPHTHRSVESFSKLVLATRDAGIATRGVAYFSDLLIENLDKLEGTTYRDDLVSNYASFCNEVRGLGQGSIEARLLSSVPECLSEIGERGIRADNSIHQSPLFQRVYKRDCAFYKPVLGWSDADVFNRTEVIFGTYQKLAEIFSKTHPKGLLYWVESMYERGLIYKSDPANIVPVIYPKEHGSRLKELFEGQTITVTSLPSSFADSLNLVDRLYEKEATPIFEHSPYHVLSYLGFDYDLFFASAEGWESVVGVNAGTVIMFTPRIKTDIKGFVQILIRLRVALPGLAIRIQNVSEQWIQDNQKSLDPSWVVAPRSREEVVYSAPRLTQLSGAHFSNLRNMRNKIFSKGFIIYRPLTPENLKDAFAVLDAWQSSQGYKYTKNKAEKERYVLQKFAAFARLDPSNISAEIGYAQEEPVSVSVMHRCRNFPKWAVLYSVKGLNDPVLGGIKGASDAAYMRCFEKASKEWSVEYINDGELGFEEGTRAHKLRFLPERFLRSYDIQIA